MTATATIRDGQIGRVVRFRTGIDLSDSTARIVRVKNGDVATVETTGVSYDADEPTDLLFPIATNKLDTEGVWSVEIEVQWSAGAVVRKCDLDVTIDVTTLDPS